MLIFQNFNGYLIIKDFDGEIDVDQLNEAINDELKRRSVIYEDDTVKRAIAKSPYIVLCDHASLAGQDFIRFVKEYLMNNDIVWCHGNLSDTDLFIVEDMLPRTNVIGGTHYGSSTTDTLSIDIGVVSLCEAINSIEGVKTFASCDGHGGHRPLYVSFTAIDMAALEQVAKVLVIAVNEEYSYHTFSKQVNISNSFNWGEWQTGSRLYFDFKVCYDSDDTEQVFNFIERISNRINKACQ